MQMEAKLQIHSHVFIKASLDHVSVLLLASDFVSAGLPLPCCWKDLFSLTNFSTCSSISTWSYSCHTKVEDLFRFGFPDTQRCQFTPTTGFYRTDIKPWYVKETVHKRGWKG